MKRVLITGASGFIGRHCIEPLLKAGLDVHCVSTREITDTQKGVTWHKANLLDPHQIKALLERTNPEYLLHLAWYVEPGKVINHPCNIEWVEKSLYLIRQFKEHGGERITIAGSCYEYDWNYGYCSESLTPRTPDTLYGIAKNSLFALCKSYSEQVKLSAAWGRVFFLYGPHENPNRLVSSVILSLLNGEKAKSSHGLQVRDYMHVQDVANGLAGLLLSDATGDFNIATGQAITLREILFEIAKQMDALELLDIGALPARANDLPFVIGDTRKFKAVSDWSPQLDLSSGIADTIAWWRANKDLSW